MIGRPLQSNRALKRVETFDTCLPLSRSWFDVVFALLIAFASLIPQVAFAAPQTCHELFSLDHHEGPAKWSDLPQKSILSERDEREIRQLHVNPSLAESKKWEATLDIYLEARLRLIPQLLRARVRAELVRMKIQFTDDSETDATSNRILIPKIYAETALPFVLRAHEWEHVIRELAGPKAPLRFTYRFNPVVTYLEETHAMQAEWELARFISVANAEKIQKLIPRNVDWREQLLISSITHFGSQNRDRAGYLRAMRAKGGRYSFAYSVQRTGERVAMTGAVVTSGALSVSAISWVFCGLRHLVAP